MFVLEGVYSSNYQAKHNTQGVQKMTNYTCCACPRDAIYVGTDVKYPEYIGVLVCEWHLHLLADGFKVI